MSAQEESAKRWTGPTNRPGTPDRWSGDVVEDARYVLGENVGGNSLTARMLAELERLRAMEQRAHEVVAAVPKSGKSAGPVVLKRAAARYILGEPA